MMNKQELEAFAREVAQGLKTEQDLAEFSQMLTKVTVEAALNAELEDHLGYARYESSEQVNSRNGYTGKRLSTGAGEFELETPRDRDGSFEPQLVKKGPRRFTAMDDKILSLYAKGMSTREVVTMFKELYDADISPTLISRVTDAALENAVEWQSRSLDAVYPIVYPDCIVTKIRQDRRVINKAVYLALGVNLSGHKELPGLAIYTTNAIESLNRVVRKAVSKCKVFPSDDAAGKVIYLATLEASKKWTRPIRDWKGALNRFIMEFEDRLIDYV